MLAWETGLDKKRDWAILILILEVVYMRRKTGWKTGRNFYQVFMEKKQAEEKNSLLETQSKKISPLTKFAQ